MSASKATYLAILTPVEPYQLVCLCRPLLTLIGKSKCCSKCEGRIVKLDGGTGAKGTKNIIALPRNIEPRLLSLSADNTRNITGFGHRAS